MKEKNIIIITILISFCVFCSVCNPIQEIKKSINRNLRFLIEMELNYDSSFREGEDKESVENCEKTDYKYFFQYISGYNVTFDKTVDTERSVRNHY